MNDWPEIENKKVIKTLKIHDYIQLYLEEEIIMTINNQYKVVEEDKEIDLTELKNEVIQSYKETKDTIIVSFTRNKDLVIDMRDIAYDCPEAMTIKTKEYLYVWN